VERKITELLKRPGRQTWPQAADAGTKASSIKRPVGPSRAAWWRRSSVDVGGRKAPFPGQPERENESYRDKGVLPRFEASFTNSAVG
jgi:hypothetical protein